MLEATMLLGFPVSVPLVLAVMCVCFCVAVRWCVCYRLVFGARGVDLADPWKGGSFSGSLVHELLPPSPLGHVASDVVLASQVQCTSVSGHLSCGFPDVDPICPSSDSCDRLIAPRSRSRGASVSSILGHRGPCSSLRRRPSRKRVSGLHGTSAASVNRSVGLANEVQVAPVVAGCESLWSKKFLFRLGTTSWKRTLAQSRAVIFFWLGPTIGSSFFLFFAVLPTRIQQSCRRGCAVAVRVASLDAVQ